MSGLGQYIKSDLYRCYGKTDFLTLLKAFFLNKGFNYLFHLRCVQHGSFFVRLINMPAYWLKRNFGGINIGRNCIIGYGLYIGHNGPVIINDSAVIGNNVNLSQFVTIGANEGNAAKIGDCVYIGPSVCIIGNITIGTGATIGAGTVVVKDINKSGTYVGVPAHILHEN